MTALTWLSIALLFGGAVLLWVALAGIRTARNLARSLSSVLHYHPESAQDFFDLALDEAIAVTRSTIGHLYFDQLDRPELVLRAASRKATRESASVDPAYPFDLAVNTEILNEVMHTSQPVVLNDFQARYPLTRSDRGGHAVLHRVLAMPVFSGERIAAVVAVANKSRAYDDTDIERLRLLMDAAWASVERRTASEALAESETRFRRLVLDAPFPVMLHADDGSILQVSRSWCDITGYAREELATMADWTARAYGERQAVMQSGIDRLYGLTHRVVGGEYAVRTRTGDTRTWSFSSAPLGRLPDGRRVVVSMAVDITERQRGEAARRASLQGSGGGGSGGRGKRSQEADA